MGRLHISPLPLDMSEGRLREVLSAFGNVKKITLYEGYGKCACVRARCHCAVAVGANANVATVIASSIFSGCCKCWRR